MNDNKNQFKHFEYQQRKYYYLIKENNIIFKEIRGEEIATTFINIYDEKYIHIDTFQVCDKKMKILFNFPNDVKIWYEKHLKDLE